jgi:hypothetical protein
MTKRTVYITKYWKTDGIIIENADITRDIHSPDGIHGFITPKPYWAVTKKGHHQHTYYGNDFWLTKKEALAFVRDALKKQLVSAENNVHKLRVLQQNLGIRIVDARKGKS